MSTKPGVYAWTATFWWNSPATGTSEWKTGTCLKLTLGTTWSSRLMTRFHSQSDQHLLVLKLVLNISTLISWSWGDWRCAWGSGLSSATATTGCPRTSAAITGSRCAYWKGWSACPTSTSTTSTTFGTWTTAPISAWSSITMLKM